MNFNELYDHFFPGAAPLINPRNFREAVRRKPMPKIYDISQTISAATPVWPGEPSPALTPTATIDSRCPVNVSAITLSAHTGAHADSPFHYSPDGASSAACALEPYIGPCRVIDARGAGASVTLDDFDIDALGGATRVLFRTYDSFPANEWRSDFKSVDASVIEALGERGVVLVGVDAPSLDPEQSKTMDAHKQVLAFDMRILEGLVLDDVGPGEYELIALPLKIAGADASPVRAILRTLR